MTYVWQTIAGMAAVIVMFVLFWLYAKACERL